VAAEQLYYAARVVDSFHGFSKGRNDIVKLAIDGQYMSGKYRADCECGQSWEGTAEQTAGNAYSPGLPIAEAVVHMRLAHPGAVPLDLRFGADYRWWLTNYWERMSRRANGRAPMSQMGLPGAPGR
jgi:hypothetical protein